MGIFVIHQIVTQLRLLPHSLQQKVLQFVRRLGQLNPQGTTGKQFVKFAGTIPADDLHPMQQAILQGCEQVDRNEW